MALQRDEQQSHTAIFLCVYNVDLTISSLVMKKTMA